jgi:hypothetical protein
MLLLGAMVGCHDNTPPPQRVPIPAQRDEGDRTRERLSMNERDEARALPPSDAPRDDVRTDRRPSPPDRDPMKSLPAQQSGEEEFHPPFDDAPLISQRAPEEPAFVDAYRRVGSPRITLFVNRTLEGKIIPVNQSERGAHDYLQRGQYDDAQASALDYQAIETIMTDWLAANGQVTIISPTMARQRLTDQQVKELQAGRHEALSEIAQQLGADVLIQVQAHPTKQTQNGLEVRLVAEAMNTKGGQSIGRAVVDALPPLEKTQINKYTRYLARKLMDDMTMTWSAPPPPNDPAHQPPAPRTDVPPSRTEVPPPPPMRVAPPASHEAPPPAPPSTQP